MLLEKIQEVGICMLILFYIYIRLLTLMFDYGQWLEVYEALNDGLKTIQVENWLQVSCGILTTQGF